MPSAIDPERAAAEAPAPIPPAEDLDRSTLVLADETAGRKRRNKSIAALVKIGEFVAGVVLRILGKV